MVSDDGGWAIPHATSREHFTSMIASGLNRALKERLGISTRMLRQMHSRHDPTSRETHVVCLMELRADRWRPPAGMRWVDAAAFHGLPLARPEQGPVLRAWFDEANGACAPTARAPWALPHWHPAADAWILEELGFRGVAITGSIEQIRCGPMSAILRVPTADGMVYFKASPEAFAHETPLTAALSRLYPDRSPRVIATDHDRGWMLMADIGGTALRRVADVTRWEGALRLYAETQMQLVGRREELDAVGCPRRTLDTLAEEVGPLLADTDALTFDGAEPGLSSAELRRLRGLAPRLKEACRALAAYRVPHTLTHGDFVAVNIAMTDAGYVFFDWAHSSVAHPFFDFQWVLPQPAAGGPSDFYAIPFTSRTLSQLTDAYLTPWTVYEPMARLRQALDLAQPLGALHHAVTFHRYVVPRVADAADWRSSVPRLLRGALAHEAALSSLSPGS